MWLVRFIWSVFSLNQTLASDCHAVAVYTQLLQEAQQLYLIKALFTRMRFSIVNAYLSIDQLRRKRLSH